MPENNSFSLFTSQLKDSILSLSSLVDLHKIFHNVANVEARLVQLNYLSSRKSRSIACNQGPMGRESKSIFRFRDFGSRTR